MKICIFDFKSAFKELNLCHYSFAVHHDYSMHVQKNYKIGTFGSSGVGTFSRHPILSFFSLQDYYINT